jgi:hypothetical protein
MHMQTKWVGVLGSLLFALLLTGCSSGDGGNDAPPAAPPVSHPPVVIDSAEGLWTGTTGDGRTISGVVLDDDTYWLWYSAVGQPSVLAGGFQGSGRSQNGAFTSSNGIDLNLEGIGPFGPVDTTFAASYVIRKSFNGVITYPTATQTSFTSTFNTDYDADPSVASLVGTYIWSYPGGIFTITIDPSGSITGTASVCDYAGVVSPRTSGNVYDVSITAVGRLCAQSGLLQTGIAWLDAATNRIFISTLNRANGAFSTIFLGTKQ